MAKENLLKLQKASTQTRFHVCRNKAQITKKLTVIKTNEEMKA